MLFSSMVFLFLFLPVVLMLYYASPRKVRNLILFVFSLVFYAWGEPIYVFLMIASTIVAYITGLLADKTKQGRKPWVPKVSLIVAILWNMGLLLFFKYTNFFIENANNSTSSTFIVARRPYSATLAACCSTSACSPSS